ncbi:MAG: hypothetical protein HY912_05010 [Desulfomonile tiedjei]|uniref:Uncharacterized protein n=1 Tax=Desulfomonile tiedjei TaxID=2358 RepID=A0A9D6Z2I9_9BACT|nr:hypothetical protein [Desulfomonile tiedjei]
MSSSKEGEKEEFKLRGLESVIEELESLSPEDKFFIQALHRRMEIDQMACERRVYDPEETDMCECERRNTRC